MGIAGLAQRLAPYATRYTPEDLNGYQAIIDGPSLAYHAHKLALAAVASHSRIPSYAEINAQAIRWLKALEDINITVSAVLFDGALPDAKRNERLSRLEQNNKQVRNYRANYPATACPAPSSLGPVSYSFLAPALREALGYSAYSAITHILPGEADDWCVSFANNSRSIIFTNDTDLFLYSYAPEGRVVFFKDVDLWPEPKFKGYAPTKMCENLKLTSLVPIAYALVQDPWRSFNVILEEARSLDIESSRYNTFSLRYTEPPGEIQAQATLQHLDVRISEFVHQAMEGTLAPIIYLPLLVEDMNQASAWNVGQNIRLLAYSLIAPNRIVVQEYKRRAQGIAMQEVKLHQLRETSLVADLVACDISSFLRWKNERQVPREFTWPLLAIKYVLQESRVAPTVSFVIRVLQGKFNDTWDFIHFIARVQAALYSIRLLKQCVVVWLAIEGRELELSQHINLLQKNLKSMPSIADLFFVPGQTEQTLGSEEQLRELISDVYAMANFEVPPENISNKKMKKRRREEARNRKKQEAQLKQTRNIFELLDQK